MVYRNCEKTVFHFAKHTIQLYKIQSETVLKNNIFLNTLLELVHNFMQAKRFLLTAHVKVL